MARKNRGKQFVKNEELPAEKHSDESATSKSSESVAKTKEKSSGCGTTALFIVGLIVGLALGGLIFYAMGSNASNTGTNDAQMNASGQKAISFISKNLIRTGDTATMINISELNKTGVYKLTLNYTSGGQSQVIDSYISNGAELICPSGIVVSDFEKLLNQSSTTTNTTTQQQANPEQACAQEAKSDKPVLEAFVVARCPFGLQMQRMLAEVVAKVPDAAKYMTVRYIGSIESGKIVSMHGDAEAQENLAQICIREEQPAKYWSYVGCQMKDGNTTGCLVTAGVDQAMLTKCMNDSTKGLAYAQKDFDLANKYQVSGSPTLLMNGKSASEFNFAVNSTSGRSAEAIKQVICCGFNTQPAFCSGSMTTAQAAVGLAAAYSSSSTGTSGSCG